MYNRHRWSELLGYGRGAGTSAEYDLRVTFSLGLGLGLAVWLRRPQSCSVRPGDRVKTDKNDALHLAKLLHLGQIVEVTIPGVAQEAARDLVRARDGVRADLMSARHRVSKLLLRQV